RLCYDPVLQLTQVKYYSPSAIYRSSVAPVTLESVTQNGSSDLLPLLARLHSDILDQVVTLFRNDASPDETEFPDDNGITPAILEYRKERVITAVNRLYDGVSIIYKRWADAMQQATATFLQAVNWANTT